MNPRFDEYQLPCLARIQEARENGVARALVVMAGGLGKTVVAAKDVKRFLQRGRRKVLVLCHDKDILEQDRETFEEILGNQYSYGFFHGRQKDFGDIDVLFATFQTMGGRCNWRHSFPEEGFSYIVVDESHHGRAKTYEEVLAYFKPDFLLGLTATPEREDGKSLEEIFGEAIFTLDFVDAWANGFLTPVDYRLVTKELTGVDFFSKLKKPFTLKNLNDKIFTRMPDEELVKNIQEQVSDLDNPRMIIFCQSIKQADKIAELYPGAKALHSTMPTDEGEENLRDFRDGSLRTLVVRDMLNEGIDVPEVDVIVRLRLTDSKLLFEQQLARGLRLYEGKTIVRVYDYASSMEQLDRLFDYEARVRKAEQRLLREQKAQERTERTTLVSGVAKVNGAGSQRFVITLTGGDVSIRKVDIQNLIARGKLGAKKFICGYDEETLLDSLAQTVKELGYMPYQSEVTENVNGKFAAVGSYLKYLGPTWEDVVNRVKAAMGVDAEKIEWRLKKHARAAYDPKMSVEEKQALVIRIIQDYVDEHRRLPTIDELCAQEGAPSRGIFRKNGVFPTYAAAIVSAGFDPQDPSIRKVRSLKGRRQFILERLAAETKKRGCPLIWEEIDKCPSLPTAACVKETLEVNDWDKDFVPMLKTFMAGDDVGVCWNRAELWRKKQKAVFLKVTLELGHIPSRREMGNRFGSQDGLRHTQADGSYNDFVWYMRPELLELAAQGKIKKQHVGRMGWFEFALGRETTRQDLIEVARRKAAQHSGPLTLSDWRSDPEMPSPYTIAKFYDSFVDLLIDAGIEVSEAQKTAVQGHQKRMAAK